MESFPHIGYSPDYGKRIAVTVSLVLHLLVLTGLVVADSFSRRKDPLANTMVVKLGGPPKTPVSGKSRKAPVAGVKKTVKPKARSAPKKKTKRTKPVTRKDQIGLDRKKKPKKKKTKPPETNAESVGKKADKSADPPVIDQREGQKAIGGIDGKDGSGVSVEFGDGSESINTEDIEFTSYLRTVLAEVNSRWAKSGLEGGTARVRFIIDREGGVSDVKVVKSSGRNYLDGPATRAVLGAEFPPLPQGYRGDFLIVNLNFRYGDHQ